MRILLASRNFFPADTVGGAQVSILLLAKALKELNHEVAVLSVDDAPCQGINENTGILEYRLQLKNLYTRGRAPLWKKMIWHSIDRFGDRMHAEFNKTINDFRPEVINTNVLAGLGLGIWKVAFNAGIPVIHTVHDYYLTCIKSSMFSKKNNCKMPCVLCKQSALRPALTPSQNVSEVIYVSKHMKSAHVNVGLFSQTTGTTIIHGAYQPDQKPSIRTGFLSPDILTVGFFGRISPEKGLDRLIKTLKELPSGTWRLRIGGSGEASYVNQIKLLAEGLPIEFLGVLDPNSFYSKVDATVIYSLWHEPAARVTYEAGMHGAVPIVSNRGGLPELVDYGQRGLIFEPDNPESLRQALLTLINDQDLIFKYQQQWTECANEFSPANVARKTIEIYKRAIQNK
jgi:glycosyltransferase involved in cell wall biosynthesis